MKTNINVKRLLVHWPVLDTVFYWNTFFCGTYILLGNVSEIYFERECNISDRHHEPMFGRVIVSVPMHSIILLSKYPVYFQWKIQNHSKIR